MDSNQFQFECKCLVKQEKSFGIRHNIPNNIRYIMPNTENLYFPMSSITYLIPKKIYLIPSGIRYIILNTEFCVTLYSFYLFSFSPLVLLFTPHIPCLLYLFGWLSWWTLLFLLLYFIFIKFFSYVHQLLHLLYSYSYFTHMFCVHPYMSTLLVCMYMLYSYCHMVPRAPICLVNCAIITVLLLSPL